MFTLIISFSAYFTAAPVSNVLVVKPTRQGTNLSHQPPLSKYVDSSEDDLGRNIVILPQPCWKPNYLSSSLMGRQLKELQVAHLLFWNLLAYILVHPN